MIDISIVIPVYNAEKFLKDCIDSILSQTFSNYEIILVDDGSTDSSSSICNEYKNKDSRILYIKKTNSGVSDSRNVGLNNAHGEWILFVDADDFLGTSNYLEKMFVFSLNNKNKMAIYQYVVNLEGNKENYNKCYINENCNKNYIIANIIRPKDYDGNCICNAPCVWGKLFNRNTIIENNIYFKKGIKMYEDGLFMLDYFKYIDDIEVIENTKYVYRIHNESAMHKFQENSFEEKMMIRDYFLNLMKLNSKVINSAIISATFGTYRGLIKNAHLDIADKNNKDYKRYIKINKDILSNKNISFRYLSKGNKLDLIIYRICPFLLYYISDFVVKTRIKSN